MEKKNNWQEFKAILDQHKIVKLYHFTDRDNLESIIKNGGLYSWMDCEHKGIKINNLLYSTFQTENEVIIQLLIQFRAIVGRSDFHEDTNAVALAHLYVRGLITSFLAKIYAIHIYAEPRLIAFLQPNVRTSYAISGIVIYPEVLRCCRNLCKDSVHLQRIERHGKAILGRCGEGIVVVAGDEGKKKDQ